MGMSIVKIFMIIFSYMLCRPGQFNQSFPILVIQINASGRVDLPENGAISMRYNISEVTISLIRMDICDQIWKAVQITHFWYIYCYRMNRITFSIIFHI